MGGGPVQQMPLIIEVAKDNWSWFKWLLGILGTVIAAFIVQKLTRKK